MKMSGKPQQQQAEEEQGMGSTEGRTVLVGVRADAADSRALLTWALVNAAAAGDRVVAVHVALAPAAAVDFDAMLAVYEGFCNLKQVSASHVKPFPLSSLHYSLFSLLFLSPCGKDWIFYQSSSDAVPPAWVVVCAIWRFILRFADFPAPMPSSRISVRTCGQRDLLESLHLILCISFYDPVGCISACYCRVKT
jgi:hypothetical protein